MIHNWIMLDEWTSPSVVRQLELNEVQIWRLTLANARGVLDECRQILSSEEQDQADRKLPGRVRHEFICGRACLRFLLAKNLGTPASSILIASSQYGKPYLPEEPILEFNVSHSHGIVLIALSTRGSVGIDLEYMNAHTEVMKLAPTVFSPTEIDRLKLLNPEAGRQCFFQTWARKEAIGKADGRGFSFPLTSFDLPDEPACNMPVQADAKLYYLNDIEVGEGHVSAIAIESQNCRMSLYDFPLAAFRRAPVRD